MVMVMADESGTYVRTEDYDGWTAMGELCDAWRNEATGAVHWVAMAGFPWDARVERRFLRGATGEPVEVQ